MSCNVPSSDKGIRLRSLESPLRWERNSALVLTLVERQENGMAGVVAIRKAAQRRTIRPIAVKSKVEQTLSAVSAGDLLAGRRGS